MYPGTYLPSKYKLHPPMESRDSMGSALAIVMHTAGETNPQTRDETTRPVNTEYSVNEKNRVTFELLTTNHYVVVVLLMPSQIIPTFLPTYQHN